MKSVSTRPKAHLYFPENDLALAANLDNYTPPLQAQIMHRDGATLPMWYGHDGDTFIASGINDRWYGFVCDTFGINVDIFNGGDHLGFEPAPWGWSKASRRAYIRSGFSAEQLPDDRQISSIRELSNRRTAIEIALRLSSVLDIDMTPPAILADNIDKVCDSISLFSKAIIKTPWSNAGRGIIPADTRDLDNIVARVAPIIRRYGQVTIEPRHDKVIDFAMLYEIYDGTAHYVGMSVFDTDSNGSYTGNIVAADPILIDIITQYVGAGIIKALSCAMSTVLADIIGTSYNGPLGVDMLVARHNGGYIIDPAVELNLRMTMGHLAHRLAESYVEPGVKAHLSVKQSCPPLSDFDNPFIDAEITAYRLRHGSLILNPPSCPTRFILTALS